MCLEDDGAAVRTVLNYLVVDSSYWQPKTYSPLITAIMSDNVDVVHTSLNFEADSVITIDEFSAAYSRA